MLTSHTPAYEYNRLILAGFNIFHVNYNRLLSLNEFDQQLNELQIIFDDIPLDSNQVIVISYDERSRRQDSLIMSMNRLRKQLIDSQRKGKIFKNIYVITTYTVPLNIFFYLIESFGIIKMIAISGMAELETDLKKYKGAI